MKLNRKLFTTLILAVMLGTACSCISYDQESETDTNAERMQRFVKDISSYARKYNSKFIIIPQNGAELAFTNTEPEDGIMTSYIAAIDGIGIEELFYNGTLDTDNERLTMLRELKSPVKIMVSDFVLNNAEIPNAIQLSRNEGFISFTRSADNYDYKIIPDTIIDENTNNIEKLADAKNHLYLISAENYENKQAMITAIAATNYDVVLIDLFFNDDPLNPADIQQLKTKANGKKRLVISYISIGSAENYRYYWQDGWKKGSPSWLKKNFDGYPDEFWVEFRHPQWQNIIFGNDNSYIKQIIDAGFDGAYLDNVEAYYFLTE